MSETTETVDSTTTETAQNAESSEESQGILRDLQAKRKELSGVKAELDAIKTANQEAETLRLTENEDFKTLLDQANAKVAEYEPVIKEYTDFKSARKSALLEQLGDDAEGCENWEVSQLEILAKKMKLNTNPPPKDPGNPGTTGKGEFGGYDTLLELTKAVARGVPGARESYNKIKGGG